VIFAAIEPRLARMGSRILVQIASWLIVVFLFASAFAPRAARAEGGVEITRASIENSEDGYRLALGVSFELTRGLEDAVTRGVPLYFTTEVQLSRPRWYWFNEKTISTSQTVRISYNVLTHQYHAAISGRLQQSFSTLDDALSLVRRPSRWVVAENGALKAGETYNVAVRMGLDLARLAKPFQVHAINSSDWRFSSDWKHFTFKAE
jgi:hypothetical protein